ncbi:MAG: DctP family TRAP transporter solute-binding subunit [Alphaproteobacteria bacterium]|nr:MAG: DctP family TRAP transporter solute-binding subunit [Alphaproteobacteria bacterium]
MKRWLSAAAVAATFAFGAANAQTNWTISHPLPTANTHYGAGATAFKEAVERLTNNRIRVTIQRNDNEREMIESMQIGTLDAAITSTGPIGNFVPDVRIVDIPFLFRDYDHARGVLDSQIGQDLLARFTPRGIIALAWTENGFRNLTNSRREVNSPDDVRGLKVRTMENQVHMRAFSTLGALPTPMAFSELVPALQQGTVDGQENPLSVIIGNNLNQVQRFISLTRHVYSPAVVMMAPSSFTRLSAADQALVRQAAAIAAKAQRDKVSSDEASGVEELRRRGMTVNTNVDTAKFVEALRPAFAEFGREFGADKIAAIQNWKP